MTFKTLALTALLISGTSVGAFAAPINAGSVLNFSGQSTCNATSCSFGTVIATSGTGSFSSFNFGTPATFNTLTYSPFTTQQVYTSTSTAGLTTTFTVTSQASQSTTTTANLTSYNVTDLGFATLTGFDNTPGSFTFTANQSGAIQGSFSTTTTVAAVPEPVSMAVLGASLVGLGFIRRRRQG